MSHTAAASFPRQVADDPTPLEAFVDNFLETQQTELEWQAETIKELRSTCAMLRESLAESLAANAHWDVETVAAARRGAPEQTGGNLLLRQTLEGVISDVTGEWVGISVENAPADHLLRIARNKFSDESDLTVGDHVAIETICTRRPRADEAAPASFAPDGEDLADLIKELRRDGDSARPARL